MSATTGGTGSAQRRAWRSPLAWGVLITTVVACLALDLGLKHWSFENVASEPVALDANAIIPSHDPKTVIPKLLNLHLVKNEGAVFGIGENQRMFFIVFTVAALSAAIAVFARWTMAGATAAHIAIGLVVAGGLGNLYDRIMYGFVRDFLHMLPEWNLPFGWHWPGGSSEIFPWVFNAADVMLLAGMATLMLYMNSVDKRRKAARTAREQVEAAPS